MAELSEKQQAMELLRSSHSVLIVLPESDGLDPLAAGVVLGQTLMAGGRTVVYFRPTSLPALFAEVGVNPAVSQSVATSREYQIKITSPEVSIEELSLHQVDQGYAIALKAKQGIIRLEELVLTETSVPPDLIVAVGLIELPAVLTELTRQTTVLPINTRRTNLGTIQLIDESASSCCELMIGLVEGVSGSAQLPTPLATLLLVGLLAATESFRGRTTTAKSLTVAAQLTAAGADRVLAFSTGTERHSVATLKLWGRLLSRLTLIPEARFAWSYVTREDLVASQASEVDVPRAIDELLTTTEGTDVVVVLLQQSERIIGFIRRVGGSTSARALADRLLEPGAEITGDEREAYSSVSGRLIDRGKELIGKLTGQPLTDTNVSREYSSLDHPRGEDPDPHPGGGEGRVEERASS